MLKIHWFLPTGGDSRDVVPRDPSQPGRQPTLSYLAQVAKAAEACGFDAVLTPCGTGCEDSWITTAALISQTDSLRFLVALRPGNISPTQAAQMASTFQRLSNGRVLINIVTGAEDQELARFGDHLDKDARYDRTGEFMKVLAGAWGSTPFDFAGDYYRVAAATTRTQPNPIPEIYFGGASEAAERVAAESADVYLAWGEPPNLVSTRLDSMRKRLADNGRSARFGIRFHCIARPTADQAWAEAAHLQAGMNPEAIAAAQRDFAATASEGQRRMASLHEGMETSSDPRALEIYPNLWAGIGLVRGGAGTALVGSFSEVADRIEEYASLGFEEFILSGYPHLEEAWWVGEGVLPELRRRGVIAEAPGNPESTSFHFR